MIHAGNWPATVPTEAFTQMVYGVFPGADYNINSVERKRIEDKLATDPDLAGHYKVEFTFDVMAGVTDVDADLSATIGVFNAACDIGFYRNLMGVPAINFGVGEKNAHSMHESIKVSDVLKLSHAVTNFLAIRGKL